MSIKKIRKKYELDDEILNIEKNITEQNWIESNRTGNENYTYMGAKSSITELRRLNFFN